MSGAIRPLQIPHNLIRYLKQHYLQYFLDYSRTFNGYYYTNHCSCGALFGDYFMHEEPGGAFFPTSNGEARIIKLKELKSDGFVALNAAYGFSVHDLIQEHAERV